NQERYGEADVKRALDIFSTGIKTLPNHKTCITYTRIILRNHHALSISCISYILFSTTPYHFIYILMYKSSLLVLLTLCQQTCHLSKALKRDSGAHCDILSHVFLRTFSTSWVRIKMKTHDERSFLYIIWN